MSSNTMLKQAIIDANALREVALKNAESIVVQKYSGQIREAVDIMLEQDEELMGADLEMGGEVEGAPLPSDIEKQAPLAATDGEALCPCPDEGGTIEVDFQDLKRIMADLDDDEEQEPLPGPTPDEVLPPEGDEELDIGLGALQEDEDIEYDLSDLLAEEQTDTLGMPADVDEEEAAEKGTEQEDDPPEVVPTSGVTENAARVQMQESAKKTTRVLRENTSLTKKNSKIIKENKSLKDRQKSILTENQDLKSILKKLSNTLEEANLSNAKLVYTNRVLTSNSLNERQKQRIAEAINGADSVEAAKSIYETLQSAVGSSLESKSNSKSLSEVIVRGNTTMLRQQQKERKQDPFMHRMKKLAGI